VVKTFGGPRTIDEEDHASTAASSTERPEPQRKVTDAEEDLTEALKRPFRDELPRPKRPNLPANVQKPQVNPNQHRPSGNRPNLPRGPRY
jgi:hypothetical protein